MVTKTLIKIRAWILVAIVTIFSPIFLAFVLVLHIFRNFFKLCNYKNIRGEVALVTGGGGGLGRCIAIELAKKGCLVAVADINLNGVQETERIIQNKYNAKAKAYQIDITNYDAVEELNKQITQDLGKVTILINNAGIIFLSNEKNPDWKDIQRMINVNLAAHFWTTQIFLPNMKAQKKGHIVAIGSLSSLFPWGFHSHYTSTKYAIRGMMRALRMELKVNRNNFGDIRTTTIMPAFLNTHGEVENMVTQSGINQMYPLIKGEAAAKRIIEAIQKNEEEVMMPSFFGLLYKIHELMPTYWQDFIMYITNTRYHKILENKKIATGNF